MVRNIWWMCARWRKMKPKWNEQIDSWIQYDGNHFIGQIQIWKWIFYFIRGKFPWFIKSATVIFIWGGAPKRSVAAAAKCGVCFTDLILRNFRCTKRRLHFYYGRNLIFQLSTLPLNVNPQMHTVSAYYLVSGTEPFNDIIKALMLQPETLLLLCNIMVRIKRSNNPVC